MNDSLIQDPRRRLRELLAIPERDRTDEQWDEIIEIEITLAPGNRESERLPDNRSPDKRGNSHTPTRRPEPRKSGTRPAAGPRPEPRPPAVRPDLSMEAQTPDARPAESRAPKRHSRRPRRPPETSGES